MSNYLKILTNNRPHNIYIYRCSYPHRQSTYNYFKAHKLVTKVIERRLYMLQFSWGQKLHVSSMYPVFIAYGAAMSSTHTPLLSRQVAPVYYSNVSLPPSC